MKLITTLLILILITYSIIFIRELFFVLNTSDETDHKVQDISLNDGYCFIGNTREGIRSCMYVDDTNHCLSNQIYPSMDLCINPNLKY